MKLGPGRSWNIIFYSKVGPQPNFTYVGCGGHGRHNIFEVSYIGTVINGGGKLIVVYNPMFPDTGISKMALFLTYIDLKSCFSIDSKKSFDNYKISATILKQKLTPWCFRIVTETAHTQRTSTYLPVSRPAVY